MLFDAIPTFNTVAHVHLESKDSENFLSPPNLRNLPQSLGSTDNTWIGMPFATIRTPWMVRVKLEQHTQNIPQIPVSHKKAGLPFLFLRHRIDITGPNVPCSDAGWLSYITHDCCTQPDIMFV